MLHRVGHIPDQVVRVEHEPDQVVRTLLGDSKDVFLLTSTAPNVASKVEKECMRLDQGERVFAGECSNVHNGKLISIAQMIGECARMTVPLTGIAVTYNAIRLILDADPIPALLGGTNSLQRGRVMVVFEMEHMDSDFFTELDSVYGAIQSSPTAEKMQLLVGNIETFPLIGKLLSRMHEQGMAHCDVKSENMLISTKNRILVMSDFGTLTCRRLWRIPLASKWGTPLYGMSNWASPRGDFRQLIAVSQMYQTETRNYLLHVARKMQMMLSVNPTWEAQLALNQFDKDCRTVNNAWYKTQRGLETLMAAVDTPQIRVNGKCTPDSFMHQAETKFGESAWWANLLGVLRLAQDSHIKTSVCSVIAELAMGPPLEWVQMLEPDAADYWWVAPLVIMFILARCTSEVVCISADVAAKGSSTRTPQRDSKGFPVSEIMAFMFRATPRCDDQSSGLVAGATQLNLQTGHNGTVCLSPDYLRLVAILRTDTSEQSLLGNSWPRTGPASFTKASPGSFQNDHLQNSIFCENQLRTHLGAIRVSTTMSSSNAY
jgi:hypothetical protein